jgi:gliding motility-associated-like protein
LAIVNAIPDARISVNINEQCLEINSFEFQNISNSFSNPDEFWDFGDGALGTGSEIVQNYSDAGSYKVTLEVENDSACVDIDTMYVTVFPTPKAAITAPGVCVNNPIDIQSNASIESGVIDKYQWNLGDGKNSADSLPNHTYRKPGKYYISLAMTSDKGCFARVKDSTNIYANPIAGISVLTPRPTILESAISFQDSSENAAEYEWDFGDGSDLEFAFDPIHEYADSGDYLVQLVVKSSDGCSDTTFRQVRVWPDYNLLLPTAFSPNADNTNDVYYLRGRHHAVKSVKWQIYTGEGIKVFESNKIDEGWNGSLFNTGEPVPAGDYQLVVVIKDVFGEQTQFNEKISVIR